jgi:hypothetical protein
MSTKTVRDSGPRQIHYGCIVHQDDDLLDPFFVSPAHVIFFSPLHVIIVSRVTLAVHGSAWQKDLK